MINTWDKVFSDVAVCIASKEFAQAKILLAQARAKAWVEFIDPRFILKELTTQEKKLQQLENNSI